jgi:hypothetical protein
VKQGTGVPSIDWSFIRKARAAALKSLQPLRRYPLIESGDGIAVQAAADDAWVLDVGAQDRRLQALYESAGRRVDYRRLDVNGPLAHDYYSFDDIDHMPPAGIFGLYTVRHRQLRCLARGKLLAKPWYDFHARWP